jgi:hypothetical protein
MIALGLTDLTLTSSCQAGLKLSHTTQDRQHQPGHRGVLTRERHKLVLETTHYYIGPVHGREAFQLVRTYAVNRRVVGHQGSDDRAGHQNDPRHDRGDYASRNKAVVPRRTDRRSRTGADRGPNERVA